MGQNLSRAIARQQGPEGYAAREGLAAATANSASRAACAEWNTTDTGAAGTDSSKRNDSPQRNQDKRSIADAIERNIVPRLVLAQGAVRRTAGPRPSIDGRAVSDFADTLFAIDTMAPSQFIDRLIAGRTPLDTIYLDLLAPAARLLGARWDDDLASFADVMMGLTKLHGLLRDYGPNYREPAVQDAHHRILLAATPGETHVFGIIMVEEFFRRAGWDVTCLAAPSAAELIGTVRNESFSVIGMSASRDSLLEPLAGCIHQIRRESRNRAVGIMVGGRVFVDRPDYVPLVGADTVATDGRQAVRQARNMLAMLSNRV